MNSIINYIVLLTIIFIIFVIFLSFYYKFIFGNKSIINPIEYLAMIIVGYVFIIIFSSIENAPSTRLIASVYSIFIFCVLLLFIYNKYNK